MALIVETGSGVSGAESYISVADADTFLKNELGNDSWVDQSTQDRERALRMATRLVDAECADKYIGTRNSASNALEWPRTYAQKATDATTGLVYYATTDIPAPLKQAVAMFAAFLIENPNHLSDLESGRVTTSTTDLGSKSFRGQQRVSLLPWAVRARLAPLFSGPEIPVRRVA